MANTERYWTFDPEAVSLSYTCKCGTEFDLNPAVDMSKLPSSFKEHRLCYTCIASLNQLFEALTRYQHFLEAVKNLKADGKPSLRLRTSKQQPEPKPKEE